jgi:NAD+ kinase
MDEADVTTDADRPTIGLLGGSPAVRRDLEGRRVREGAESITAADPDVIVTVGEAALGDRLELETNAPTLPVDVGPGIRSVGRDALNGALETVIDGDAEWIEYPVLAVSVDGGDRERALFDVTLVSDRPAHISAFGVTQGGQSVLDTRADGVVVATPAGSHGYARAAGGVRVAGGTEALAIVPISAFATSDERWITPIESLSVSIEREETPVEVRADDRVVGTVAGGATVEVTPDGGIGTVVPPTIEAERGTSTRNPDAPAPSEDGDDGE